MSKANRDKRRHKHAHKRAVQDIDLPVLRAIVERTQTGALDAKEYEALKAVVETLAFFTQELEAKGASIARLRKLIFGASTEKTSQVLKGSAAAGGDQSATGNGDQSATASPGEQTHDPSSNAAGEGNGVTSGTGKPGDTAQKGKAPGHGRNGASAYRGASRIVVPHPTLKAGDSCVECPKGKVYPLEPGMLVRIRGVAPLAADVYEQERLRCNACGKVFTAPAPAGVGEKKYDETATAMIGLIKYGAGLPFNRIEKLQQAVGIPMPVATQWELVRDGAKDIRPVVDELIDQAAQGELLHNDDTPMKILELMGRGTDKTDHKEAPLEAPAEGKTEEKDTPDSTRTGVFTTGIVSESNGHRIALFFTGAKHAGENLAEVLAKRDAERGPPIQMSDALSRNVPGEFMTIMASCLAHARRRFVDVVDDFPDECRHLLEQLREVYKNDALTRQMSPEERLAFHQAHSGPLMAGLEKWLRAQLDERKVEPNSGLGEAITYMIKHWSKLTLFLRVAGAPLDNNICERTLKKAILHRKNSLFYKTENGAAVGDAFMTLIHTAELHHVESFPYLVALLRHRELIAEHPEAWMPWNYQATLAGLTASTGLSTPSG
jgi:transposase